MVWVEEDFRQLVSPACMVLKGLHLDGIIVLLGEEGRKGGREGGREHKHKCRVYTRIPNTAQKCTECDMNAVV